MSEEGDGGGVAREFVEWMLDGTTGDVYVCSLPNTKGGSLGERHVSSRDVEKIVRFVERWDRPGRATYYSIGTIEPGSTRNEASVVENGFTGIDLDLGPGDAPQDVVGRLLALECPPTRVHLSGHGVHALWQFDRPCTDKERFKSVGLAVRTTLDGDRAFTPHCAALLRLPGTHNSQDGERVEVTVARRDGPRHTIQSLESWLGASGANPYLETAALFEFRPPMDVEEELLAMGPGNVHDTQLRAMASLLSGGVDEDEAVEVILSATRRVGDDGWDWEREEKDLRRMGEDWRRKRARDDVKVVSLEARRRARQGSASAAEPADAPEPKEREKKGKKDKQHHVVLGQAVVNAVRARGDDLMIVEELLWRCHNGVWSSLMPSAARGWLDLELERGCRALKLPSANRLVNEARSWILRNPDLSRTDVPWDQHGGVPTKSGLLDLETLTVRPFESEDYASYRVEAAFDAAARCPRWDQLLLDAFPDDAGTIEFLQEAIGAALVEHKSKSMTRAVVLVGQSNSGKSTLISVVSGFLSANVNSTPIDGLENAHGTMAFLQRAPWILHEAFEPSKWHFSATVKALLSGDPVSVNVKNGPIITKSFKVPVVWGANSSPQFKEATKAMENRIKIVQCHKVFDEKSPSGVALVARDQGYDGPAEMVLATERAGLLNWAVEGWLRLKARGHFVETDEMAAAARAMRAESNVALGFVDECVRYTPDKMVSRPDFYAAFTAWWRENKGEGGKNPSPDALGRAIVHLYEPRIATDKHELVLGGGVRFYAGLELNEVGLDFWSGAANEIASKGDGARVSGSVDEVNREVPNSWAARPSVVKMRNAHAN